MLPDSDEAFFGSFASKKPRITGVGPPPIVAWQKLKQKGGSVIVLIGTLLISVVIWRSTWFGSNRRGGGPAPTAATTAQAEVRIDPEQPRRVPVPEYQRPQAVFTPTLNNPFGATRGYIDPNAPRVSPPMGFGIVGENPVVSPALTREQLRQEADIAAAAVNVLLAEQGIPYSVSVEA